MTQTNFSGPVQSAGGFKVGSTTVIDSNGKLVESAGIEIADGDTFKDTNGNEALEFTVTASAVNHLGVVNSATGNNPILRAEGEADTGVTIDNSEGEEIVIFDSVATSVNEFTMSSAATGNAPTLAATGDDTNIDVKLSPKGSGAVDTAGATVHSEITSSSGAGAVGITGSIHEITTTGTGDALTLANGTAGQKLTVIYVAEGAGADTAVLTPTTLAGGTTITFNALGDSADLTYSATGGWYMHGGTAAIA